MEDELLALMNEEARPDVSPAGIIDEIPQRPVGRYIIGLALLAALAIGSTVIVYQALSRQESDAGLVHIASSQAGLAQQLIEDAEAVTAASTSEERTRSVESLAVTREALFDTHQGLVFGSESLSLPGSNSEPISAMFVSVSEHFSVMMTGADEVIAAARADASISPGAIAQLVSTADLFAAEMASIAFRYQVEAEERVIALKKTQYVLLSITILVLFLEGLFLYRPAVRAARRRWRERAEKHSSERDLDQRKLTYLARYDPLTGLINRTLFADRLQSAVARARRDGGLVALMFLDVDDFKEVNDHYGHATGDILLRQIAGRLVGSVRESDTVARLGGDEFTVILEGGHRVEDAGKVATKVLSSLAAPFQVGQNELRVTASIGISIYPVDGDSAQELLKGADIAMYSAKTMGRNTYQYFTRELRDKTSERLSMIDGLRHAVEAGDQLELVYQPKVDIDMGTVIGLEALLRWNHPEEGRIYPARFIPLAEETDLIVPIGEWVLTEACSQMRRWHDDGLPPVTVSVNISPRQFRLGNMVETVESALASSGLEAKYLELELTEGTLVADVELARRTLERLRDMGVQVAIDDFGTGYSSLSYLQSLPIDTLKIDRSFIRDVADNRDGAAISAAIIGLARSLRLEVIAEGVEREDQVDSLRHLGCRWLQGFYVSEPLPASEVIRFVHAYDTTAWSTADTS